MFRKKNRFVERSLLSALSFFQESVLSDEYASRRGLLQPRDPRFKVLGLLCLVVTVMALRDLRGVALVYLLVWALALASRIDIIFFLKRTWVFVPLFSLFIAVPALFSSFTPGDPVWVVPGIHAVVTRQGLSTASLFVLRVATSVSLAVLMTLTTRRSALFSAMRSLGIPQVFVMTLSMCYRYVHLFAGIIQDTYRAIKSRTGGYIRSGKGREMVGWNIACLWQRAQRMNEQVYNAMLSRGYTGEEPMRKI